MKITYKKLDEFKNMAEVHKKAIRPRLDQAYVVFNNQYSTELKAISEYNFWNGYTYAMIKIEQYKRLKPNQRRLVPQDESNPLDRDIIDIEK